ncbi:MAG TPA: alpha/beta hydrolase [Methylomirabilota bacterium]|nr:alpha/beta hydrolase [Methylomirabilota bacterium]
MSQEITPTRSGHLEVDGFEIWWEQHGTGDRECCCLLNGLAMHTKAWYGFLPRLTDRYDVILYDYLGQGESSKDDVPYLIPEFAGYLSLIMDEVGVAKLHLMGISYGGFIGLDFARLYPEKLHTLVLSGILLSHEKLFQLYQEISLRFYRSTEEVFEIYTQYMYEKIFGEAFAAAIPPESFEAMRQRFYDRYVDQRHCLIRLTEAQDPFFGALETNMPGYRAIPAPTVLLAGSQDRAIPLWQQKRILDVIPDSRWLEIPGSGHVVYLEQPDLFFGSLRRFFEAKSTAFEPLAGVVG